MSRLTNQMKLIEELMENPTYIRPPRKYLFSQLMLPWFTVFLGAVLSVGFMGYIFAVADLVLYIRYHMVIRLWKIYYNKVVLGIITVIFFALGFCMGPLIRSFLWRSITSINRLV